jgi:hypothetical protein
MTDINPLEYIEGEARVWIGAFGATEPPQTPVALEEDPGAGWTFLGATQGGVTWEDDQTVTGARADQVIDEIGGRVTARKTMVTFSLMQGTLANLAASLNGFGSTSSPVEGVSVYDPGQMTAGDIPGYSAILVDGWAPQLSSGGKARRRGIFRKLLNTGAKVGQQYDPTKQALIPVSFQCYWVGPGLSPYVIVDQTASS